MTPPVDLTSVFGAEAATFFLVFARIGGLFVLAPVFASRMVPMRIRLALGLGLSFVAMPHATKGVALDPFALAPLLLKELLLGTALAFSAAGVYAAIQLAGSLIDTTIGFSLANVVDPTLNFQSTVTAQIYGLLGSMVFLGSGAHLILVRGLVLSFDTIPVTAMPNVRSLSGLALHAVAPLFLIGLQIASPIVATLFVTDIAFGLLARLVPQLQPMAIQFSVKIVVGLGALVVSLPFTLQLMGDQFTSALARGGFTP